MCGQTFSSYIEPVSRLQERVINAIFYPPNFSNSPPIFKNNNLLRLPAIFKLKLLTFVYESINKISPTCFHNFFSLSSSVHQYQTRQSSGGCLFLLQCNSQLYGIKSIRYHGAKLWNTLFMDIRNSPTKYSLKKKLKTHLIISNNIM